MTPSSFEAAAVPAPAAQLPGSRPAMLLRRLMALVYDLIVLAGLAFAAAVPVVLAAGGPPQGLARVGLQAWLLLVCGGYVSVAWHRSGATLGMQAWGLEVVTREGARPGWGRAAFRFVASLLLIAPAGLGLWWMLFDREGRALQDRLSGTLVRRRVPRGRPA